MFRYYGTHVASMKDKFCCTRASYIPVPGMSPGGFVPGNGTTVPSKYSVPQTVLIFSLNPVSPQILVQACLRSWVVALKGTQN